VLNKDHGKTIVMVTHDRRRGFGDHELHLGQGRSGTGEVGGLGTRAVRYAGLVWAML
jgi:hypothetical protein